MHRPPRRSVALLLLLAPLAMPGSATAQADRYQLGLRLRSLERQWTTAGSAAKARACEPLEGAVAAFFRMDLGGVARQLDQARFALVSENPPPADAAWAAALGVKLRARLVDRAAGPLSFTVAPLYQVESKPPTDIVVHVRLVGVDGAGVATAVDELPLDSALPLGEVSEGDHLVAIEIRRGEELLASREQGLSIVRDLDTRLAAVRQSSEAEDGVKTTESRTLRALGRMCQAMTRQRAEETVLPGARLLAEAEELTAAVRNGERYYDQRRTGQFWLRLVAGRNTFSLRLLVPDGAAREAKPRPLVLALHGAGGSENLFFDGYGDGEAVRQCARRGWLLAAPRSSGFGAPDLPGLVDALAARYPVDRARVFVVGHSMGAGQAVAAACAGPDRFAAVAALGGGGSVRRHDELAKLPFLVAAGERDFGRRGAERLAERLRGLGAPTEYRSYRSIEHMAIVQESLPDVFAFFDRIDREQ